MQEFNDIQSLWHSHSVEVQISADDMLLQAKKEVSNIRNKSRLNLMGMLLSFTTIAALWSFFDFQSWETHAGITIIVTAVAIYTLILYRNHKLISSNDFTAHPKEFLQNLKTYRITNYALYNKLYWFYAAALFIGLLLYFLETVSNLTIYLQLGIGLFTLLWMIFSATLLRKKFIKKEKESLDLLIEKFERISSQFQENE